MKGFILFLLCAAKLLAVNAITVGTLTLDSTFECISVKAAFTQDDNANATALVEYKAQSSGTWLSAYTPYIDRRTTISGNANPNVSNALVSIVGLTQGTAYDVRITWSDADGVTGTNPVVGAVTTVLATPPTGGTQYYCDTGGSNGTGTSGSPFNNMASLIAAMSAGDTGNLAGTFGSNTAFTKSGTSVAWIKFQAWAAHTTPVFPGTTASLTPTGSYIWLTGLTFNGATSAAAGTNNNLTIPGTSNNIRIDYCTFNNVCPNGTNTASANYGAAGLFISTGAHHIYFDHNTITASVTSTVDYNSSFAMGVYIQGSGSALGTIILSNNTLTGNMRDGFGGEGNSMGNGLRWNSDVYGNTITSTYDDQIEVDGDDVNVRVWNNNLDTTNGNDCLSFAGVTGGPLYVFRNYLHGQGLAVKQANGSPGPVFFFHNTINVTNGGPNGNNADGMSDGGGPTASTLVTTRNNVFKTERYCIYQGGQSGGSVSVRSNSYDYDCLYSVPGYGTVADSWDYTTTYTTIGNLRTGTAGSPDFSQQETNGVGADPLLNANGTLQVGSPALNVAVSLPNFNGANSAWPNYGAGPDMGAFEQFITSGSTIGGKTVSSGKSVGK